MAAASLTGDRQSASSYLDHASQQPSLIADRSKMIEHYLEDIEHLARQSTAGIPPRNETAMRAVTWNLNCLLGADGQTCVPAAAIAEVLASLDADVLVLQEVPVDASLAEVWAWPMLDAALPRIRELDAALVTLGYTTLRRSPATNPTLLATRLPVRLIEALPLDAEPTRTQHWSGIWSESRAAVYAELEVRGCGVAVYATHLHHNDTHLATDGTRVPGVRRREVTALLEHWQRRATATRSRAVPPVATTLVLADFNQPLQRHHTVDEWRVVAAGLTSPAVGQPEADGVEPLLREHGFRCAFQAAGSGSSNNFGGRTGPPMTHWTGTTVDFVYAHSVPATVTAARREAEAPPMSDAVLGCYVCYTSLSDHLPVLVDYSL